MLSLVAVRNEAFCRSLDTLISLGSADFSKIWSRARRYTLFWNSMQYRMLCNPCDFSLIPFGQNCERTQKELGKSSGFPFSKMRDADPDSQVWAWYYWHVKLDSALHICFSIYLLLPSSWLFGLFIGLTTSSYIGSGRLQAYSWSKGYSCLLLCQRGIFVLCPDETIFWTMNSVSVSLIQYILPFPPRIEPECLTKYCTRY